MSECIFCKIANHELESKVLYEDTDFMAFQDVNPVAPTHVLLIPKKHVSSLLDQGAEEELLGKMTALVPRLAKKLGIADDGFRLVVNTGQEELTVFLCCVRPAHQLQYLIITGL
jgi:histidine triad (HIT) family protein